MILVVDGSAMLSFLLKDERSTAALGILDLINERPVGHLIVPAHFWIEVTNGLLMAERRHRASRSEISEALQFLFALPFETDDQTSERCSGDSLALAREYDLTMYDAAYLELALRHGGELASLDKALVRAAKSAGVRILT